MKTCKACGYTRTPTDEAPEYECPACGRVYAKVEARLATGRATREEERKPPVATLGDGEHHQHLAPPNSARNLRPRDVVAGIIVGILSIGLIVWFQGVMDRPSPEEQRRQAQAAEVARKSAADRAAREARERDPAYIAEREREKREREARSRREAEEREAARKLAEHFQALAALSSHISRWDDAARVAGATPRVALAAPVMQLQAIRREASTVQVTSCLQPAKVAMLSAMEHRINAMLAFMAQDDPGKARHFAGEKEQIGRMTAVIEVCGR